MNRNNPIMHNKILLFIATLCICLSAHPSHDSKLVITFFGSPTCEECLTIKEKLLKPILIEHPSNLEIHFRSTEDPKDFVVMAAMEKGYNVTSPEAQELFFPDTVLLGYNTIMATGRALIEKYLASPQKWEYRHAYGDSSIDTIPLAEHLKQRISRFTFIGLFAAGFVDGINPCAIATMIFLISFLGTQQRTRRDVLKIGLAFTGTVFVTYLGIGLGAFKILSMFQQIYWVALGIRVFAVSVAIIVALMSIRDAIVYYKRRDTSEMKVQLPKSIKLLIHSVIKGNLTPNRLVVGAIITGFLVTLLMGACTAKIYLPTIVLMTQHFGFKLLGWGLLLFYNFLFVLPLLIVMISAAYGMKWNKLAKYTQKHLALSKVLLALVLFALAAFISIGR